MMRFDTVARYTLITLIIVLNACTPITRLQEDAKTTAIEKEERRARFLLEQGKLAEAVTRWQILLTLDPTNASYQQQLDRTQATINAQVNEHITLARRAFGDNKQAPATRNFLIVLALDPRNEEASASLKTIERQQRKAMQLARARRLNQRMMIQPKQKPRTEVSVPVPTLEQPYLELGMSLFDQGNYDASVRELKKHMNIFPNDTKTLRYIALAYYEAGLNYQRDGQATEALRHFEASLNTGIEVNPELNAHIASIKKNLADDYYKKGLRIYRSNIDQAIEYWKTSVRYDPQHVSAKLRLKEAERMKEKLNVIK